MLLFLLPAVTLEVSLLSPHHTLHQVLLLFVSANSPFDMTEG